MKNALDSYRKMVVNTSSPVENIVLIHEKCLRHMVQFRHSIERKTLEQKQASLKKIMDIISALDNGLDFSVGKIAEQLHLVYESIMMQLTMANSKNETEPITVCEKWLLELLDTWRQIGKADTQQ